MTLCVKSDEGGTGQLFHFEHGPTEENSVHFYVEPGVWTNVRLPLPALWPRTAFLIDPPGTTGSCYITTLGFQSRLGFQIPESPGISKSSGPIYPIKSGTLSLEYFGGKWGDFRVENHHQTVAGGRPEPIIGYLSGNTVRWIILTNTVKLRNSGKGLTAQTTVDDPDEARWQFEQDFKPGTTPGTIDVESVAFVDRKRPTVFLPLWIMLAGSNETGTNKTQAVFPGLEYLENEPSSSQADLIVPAFHQLMSHGIKPTSPLMAVAFDHHYIGFIWERQPELAAFFDSPDRTFKSGRPVLGLFFPRASPETRDDGQLLPYAAVPIKPYRKLVLRGTIICAAGDAVVPAVQQYVALRGLPPVPKTNLIEREFYTREAGAWLDYRIREGAKFRHAMGDNLKPVPALDAAYYMDWLAGCLAGNPMARRLSEAAQEARHSSHQESIVFQAWAISDLRWARSPMVRWLKIRIWLSNRRAAFSPDSGRHHRLLYFTSRENRFEPHPLVSRGERAGCSAGCQPFRPSHLCGRFRPDSPALSQVRPFCCPGRPDREVPLHTPDILACAHPVHAYTLAYEVTGESNFLEKARYWAWTGVPLVYLTPPTGKPIGLYDTIPVLGATEYVGPVWMGLPVQWCGLVYADAIRRFATFDPTGPWKQLANGITASGVQQIHPQSQPDKQGLLPDSFDLLHQTQNPVPINPATLMYFDADPIYDYHSFRGLGILVYSPRPIEKMRETWNRVAFRTHSWAKPPWHVLINGVRRPPSLKLNARNTPLGEAQVFRPASWQLILTPDGPTNVEIME